MLKLKQLQDAAKELNKIFKPKPLIDVDGDLDTLIADVAEGSLMKEDSDPDDLFSDELTALLASKDMVAPLKAAHKKLDVPDETPEEPEEVEATEVVEDTLEDQIENAESLKQLKTIATDNDEFEEVDLKIKDLDELREAMLAVLPKKGKKVAPVAAKKGKAAKEDVEEVEDLTDLETAVERYEELETALGECETLKELKDFVKNNKEFKAITPNLASFKTSDDLQSEIDELMVELKPATTKATLSKKATVIGKGKEAPVKEAKKVIEKEKEVTKKSSGEKTKLGHKVGSQAGNIDDVLVANKAKFTSEKELVKAAKVDAARFKGHVKWLVSKENHEIKTKDEDGTTMYRFIK